MLLRVLYHFQCHGESREDKEEGKVEYGKQGDVLFCFLGIVVYIFFEGDKAGDGCNEGPHAADVDAY